MAEKIKITYIMPSMARGGAERFLLDLLTNLNRELFAPSIILFKDNGLWHEELSSLNFPIITLSKKSWIGIKNVQQIYKTLKEIKPQIVHTQLGGDIRGRLAAKMAGVKIIISTEQNINKSESCAQRLAKIISSFWANTIVAISSAVASDMRRRYFLNNTKCNLIIPNGVNLEKFTYQEKRLQQKPWLIGAVGRLTKQKGFDLLISAWQKLNPQNAKLLIAGEGMEKKALQGQINAANLNEQIELVGDTTDMPNFYKRLNLLVIPSRWEGLGVVALEAGASGLPIVASDADGLKDIVSPETGWVAKLNDMNSLSQTLGEALNAIEKNNTEKKQRALHDLIVKNFSIQSVSAAYSELYLKLWRQIYENTTSK